MTASSAPAVPTRPINSRYHPIVSRIIDLLENAGVEFETFEHEPVRTSEEAAQLRDGYTLHQGAKALLARIKLNTGEKKFVMLVLPGDFRFDSKKVQAECSAKDLRFATVEEVAAITDGILPGGVPPFGHLFGLEVIADPSLLENERVIFNAGDRAFSIALKTSDYMKVVNPRVVEIV